MTTRPRSCRGGSEGQRRVQLKDAKLCLVHRERGTAETYLVTMLDVEVDLVSHDGTLCGINSGDEVEREGDDERDEE